MVIALAISLLLFLLAPFFRKWVDLVVWPRIADWWASRSQASIRKRIEKLETISATIELLAPLNEFEDLVLRCINGMVVLLVFLPLLALFGYLMIFGDRQHPFKSDYRTTMLGLLTFLYSFIGLLMLRFVERFRLERYVEYKTTLRNDIEALRTRLR